MVAPILRVTASGATTVGLQVFANVNVAGANAPTGTLTYSLFGPGDPQCGQAPLFTSTVAVTSISVDSQRYTTVVAGTYRWQVSYSGDAVNAAVPPTPCANPLAAVIVSPATTVVAVSAAAPVGGSLLATAHIYGYSPTGTITFYLTPPGDMFCSTAPVFTSTVTVNGVGTYTSGRYQLPAGGQYKWRAVYSGDTNNMGGVITACLDQSAAVVVATVASFTYPRNAAINVDPTAPFTWTPATGVPGYLLMVGTTPGGWDLAWSGQLPANQTSYNVGVLPAGPLYATLYTLNDGTWTVSQSVTFTATANLTNPSSDQSFVSASTVGGVDG